MDFVPRPRRSNTPTVDVPLLPGMPYLSTPPGEIKKYLTPPEMDINESATAMQIATFMQSRLFFGLLAQYLKTIPDLNEWTVQDQGDGRYRRLVSLDKLAKSPFGEFERIKITSEKSGLQGIFSGLRSLMDELEYLPNAHEYPVPQVALSVRVLADALQTLYINEIGRERFILNTFHSAKTQNFRPCYERRPAFYSTQDTVSPSLQIIHQRFKDNGWCHSRANMLSKSFTYITLYYMSQIKRCHPAGVDHQDCSESICTAAYRAAKRDGTDVSKPQHVRIRDTYEEGVYAAEPKTIQDDLKVPNHLKGICIRKRCNDPCRMYHVRIEKVIEILEKGWIPLVQIKPDEDGFLDVIPANMNSRYVAISHVWSDGMGNEEENGLFECQLRNILESLPHLPTNKGEVMSPLTFNRQHTFFPWSIPGFYTRNQPYELFWLDVLCIPTKQNLTLLGRGRDMDDIRRTAVGQIAATFAGAAQVLVLDGETQTLRRDMCKMPEILAHFTACNWSARAWTYSEGAESLRAHVKLADGFFDPRDYELDARDWSGFTRRNPWSVRQLLQTSLEDVYSSTTFEKAIERCLSRTLQDFIHKSWFTKINRETDTTGPYIVSVWHSLQSRFRISRPPVIVFETAHRFVKVWNEMLTRDCTKPGDLMIIFAMALEIPAYEIFATKDNKLKAMIWSLQEVPLGLLFTPCREKIQDNQHYDDDYWARIDLRANLNDLYPLRSTILVQGKFSAQKDSISFNFPGDSDIPGSPGRAFEGNENIKVIAIPSLPGGFSWIKLLINGRVSLIRIHSPVVTATAHVILIVDKLTFALEKGYSGKWAAGCCLFVQEVRSTRSENTDSKWEFRTTYGSSISMMCYGDARNDQRIPDLLDKELAMESVALVEIHDKVDESGPTAEIHDAILISLRCTCPETIFSPVDRRDLLNPHSLLAIEDPVSSIPLSFHYALSLASLALYFVAIMPILDSSDGVTEKFAWSSISIAFISLFPAITLSTLSREFSRLLITLFLFIYIKRGVMKFSSDSNIFKTVWKNPQLVTTGDTLHFLAAMWIGLLGPILQVLCYHKMVKEFRDFNNLDKAYLTITAMNIASFPITLLASFAWPFLSRTLWLISFSRNMATLTKGQPSQTRELWQRVALGELGATFQFLWKFNQIKEDSKVSFQ